MTSTHAWSMRARALVRVWCVWGVCKRTTGVWRDRAVSSVKRIKNASEINATIRVAIL